MLQNHLASLPGESEKRRKREQLEADALRAQINSAESLDDLRAEVNRLSGVLQSTQDTLAEHIQRYHEQREADAVQAVVNAKKQRRHEYKVAVFTFLLTLAVEHFFDTINLIKVFFEQIFSLF